MKIMQTIQVATKNVNAAETNVILVPGWITSTTDFLVNKNAVKTALVQRPIYVDIPNAIFALHMHSVTKMN